MAETAPFTIRRDVRHSAGTGFIRRGQGETVLLVHGVGMNASIWEPQIEALSRRFDVVAADMPGHGDSERPPRHADLRHYADRIAGLMDRLDIAQARLVGHSMGALVSLELALSHPRRVERLAALNAVFRRSDDQKAAIRRRAAQLETGGVGTTIDESIARWFPSAATAGEKDAAARARAALLAVDPEGYATTYGLFASSDEAFVGRLGDLGMPALFITGENDANSSPRMSRDMAGQAPYGRAEILPGERHMMTLTAPDRVNERLLSFLAADRAELMSRPVADGTRPARLLK